MLLGLVCGVIVGVAALMLMHAWHNRHKPISDGAIVLYSALRWRLYACYGMIYERSKELGEETRVKRCERKCRDVYDKRKP